MITVGESIKALRQQNNWTQKILSERTGIPKNIIFAYEHDKCYPEIEHLRALADAFNVSVAVIDQKLL